MISVERANEMLLAVGHDENCSLPMAKERLSLRDFTEHWEYHFDQQQFENLSRAQLVEQSKFLSEMIKGFQVGPVSIGG
jgi:hypothetical protein